MQDEGQSGLAPQPARYEYSQAPKIIVDSREPELVFGFMRERQVQPERALLRVGDYILSPECAIERKTVRDFMASLFDGRLFEQAWALKDAFAKPLLVIEGDLASGLREANNPASFWGALLMLELDVGLSVLPTPSLVHTVDALCTLARRLPRGTPHRAVPGQFFYSGGEKPKPQGEPGGGRRARSDKGGEDRGDARPQVLCSETGFAGPCSGFLSGAAGMTFLQDQALQQLRLGTCLNTVDSPPRGPALIPLDALRRHVCILGSTGSGKSTTSAIICKELARLKVPVAVLDRTGEYAQPFESAGAKVLRPGESMAMTLFGLSKGETPRSLSSLVEDWLSLLDDYFHVSFSAGMSPLQARVLREVFSGYYQGTKETLTVSRLISRLEAYSKEARDLKGWVESIEALVSRLYPMTVDLVGATLDRSWETFEVGQLFEPSLTVVDLSELPDDRSRNLVSQVVLKRVFEHINHDPI